MYALCILYGVYKRLIKFQGLGQLTKICDITLIKNNINTFYFIEKSLFYNIYYILSNISQKICSNKIYND